MHSTTLQEQAKALGDPTRHAIFRHVAQAGRPIGVAELNEQFPLNPHAICQQLAQLVAAGPARPGRTGPAGPSSGVARSGWFGYTWRTLRGGAVAARRAHNPKVPGSSPGPAT